MKYAQEREQFGKSISTFQAVRFRLVDMLARLKTAELYSYYAAWKADRGEKIVQEAAMAKLVASEAANYICRQDLSIFGGYGLMMEYPAQPPAGFLFPSGRRRHFRYHEGGDFQGDGDLEDLSTQRHQERKVKNFFGVPSKGKISLNRIFPILWKIRSFASFAPLR